ncbi:TPA: hypothetical protein TT567_000841 [Streptococcus equi subsp. zooepidemicus]|nr:hypothetical protein [Streptococcus equi subsp. zooepidemicus]
MKILAIDPSSNKIKTSTTGIVLLENARLVDSWAISYGMKGFAGWFHEIGGSLEIDTVVIEQFEARDSDKSKDNSVLETIAYIQLCYPDAVLQRNAGYKSDIPDNLLKELKLWKFKKSHHQDIRAAARLGLFWAMRNDVEEVVQDIGRAVSEHRNHAQKVAS